MTPSGIHTCLQADNYKHLWETCIRHSTHPRDTYNLIRDQVLPHLCTWPDRTPTCLDVGAGDGTLSWMLSNLFNVTALDCNPAYYEPIVEGEGPGSAPTYRLRRPPPCSCGRAVCRQRQADIEANETTAASIRVLVADFLQADLGGQQFDLVVASHMLYQMPAEVVQSMLRKLLSCVQPSGFLIVGHTAAHGSGYEFSSSLIPDLIFSPRIVQELEGLGVHCHVFPTPNPCELDTREEVEAVLRFVALEDCCIPGLNVPEPSRIEEAIQRHMTKIPRNERGYIIPDEFDLILVRREG